MLGENCYQCCLTCSAATDVGMLGNSKMPPCLCICLLVCALFKLFPYYPTHALDTSPAHTC